MDPIQSTGIQLVAHPDGDARRKQEVAVAFEELFARHLVRELTKESFDMADNHTIGGSSSQFYREFVVDALSTELAVQRRLGMADLIERFWEGRSAGQGVMAGGNEVNTEVKEDL